jgi:hypothetical protein
VTQSVGVANYLNPLMVFTPLVLELVILANQ